MREEGLEAVVVSKTIDNSGIVRVVDPRSSRDLWLLVTLVTALVGGLALYAWPHFENRQTGIAAQQMSRERERLIEENRKLRLERASLENLRRIETIAVRELHLTAAPEERVIVIERPAAVPDGERLVRAKTAAEAGAVRN